MIWTHRNSLVGNILTQDAIDKFDVDVTQRCSKNHSISAIGSRWQPDNEDLFELTWLSTMDQSMSSAFWRWTNTQSIVPGVVNRARF